jgi:hypothetical protein
MVMMPSGGFGEHAVTLFPPARRCCVYAPWFTNLATDRLCHGQQVSSRVRGSSKNSMTLRTCPPRMTGNPKAAKIVFRRQTPTGKVAIVSQIVDPRGRLAAPDAAGETDARSERELRALLRQLAVWSVFPAPGTPQRPQVIVIDPEKTGAPVEFPADQFQQCGRGLFQRRSRHQDAPQAELRQQTLLVSLTVRHIARKAARMQKLVSAPAHVGADLYVPDASVLAAQPGLIVTQRLSLSSRSRMSSITGGST